MQSQTKPQRSFRFPALLCAAAVAVPLATGGCTADQGPFLALAYSDDGAYLPHQLATGLVADEAGSPLPDVPKPHRFVVVPSRSSASTDGLARTANYVFQGRAIVADLETFYRDQLRSHGWTFGPAGDIGPIFNATKNTESVQVALSRAGGVSTVTVLIRPR